MYGETAGVTAGQGAGEASGIQCTEARYVAKHPTMLRTMKHTKNVNVAEVMQPCRRPEEQSKNMVLVTHDLNV